MSGLMMESGSRSSWKDATAPCNARGHKAQVPSPKRVSRQAIAPALQLPAGWPPVPHHPQCIPAPNSHRSSTTPCSPPRGRGRDDDNQHGPCRKVEKKRTNLSIYQAFGGISLQGLFSSSTLSHHPTSFFTPPPPPTDLNFAVTHDETSSRTRHTSQTIATSTHQSPHRHVSQRPVHTVVARILTWRPSARSNQPRKHESYKIQPVYPTSHS